MFDLQLLAKKLRSCRSRLEYSFVEISAGTGIKEERLKTFEDAKMEPTGDEILIHIKNEFSAIPGKHKPIR